MVKKLIKAYLESPKAYFTEIIYSLFIASDAVITVTDFYIQTHEKETLSNMVNNKPYKDTDATDYVVNSLINTDGLPFYIFLFHYFYSKDDADVIVFNKIIRFIKTETNYGDKFSQFLGQFLHRFDDSIYDSYQDEAFIVTEVYEEFYDRYIKNIEL